MTTHSFRSPPKTGLAICRISRPTMTGSPQSSPHFSFISSHSRHRRLRQAALIRRRRLAATSSSSGKANRNSCHVEPLWTDPGWNLHTPAEICIDSFQADRAPDHRYRTSPIGELFTHFKGGFYHDGRFANLQQIVDHYNTCMSLGLASNEKAISSSTC